MIADDKAAEPPSARPASQTERLARLYLVLSRTNRAIELATDETALLAAACQTVVDVGGFRMSWAGTVDAPKRLVRPVAVAGHADGYPALVRIELDGERSQGPTGQSLHERRTIVCDDIATDPRMGPWREEALRRGYRSSLALPLLREGEPSGVLTVYADQPRQFDAADVELLEELARDISFGLTTLAAAKARRDAETALAESEERFRTSFEVLLDPFVILRAVRDPAGQIVDFVYEFANDAACAYNRLPPGELVGRRLLSVLPAHDAAGLLAMYAHVVETGEPLVLDDLVYGDTWGGESLERVFDVRASRVRDGLAYTWRDVTERRQAERRRAQDLEQRVRERTAELEAARERAFAVADLSTALLEATNRAEVGRRLVETAARVSGATDGIVALVDAQSDALDIVATLGYPEGTAEAFAARPKGTASPIRDVVRTGRPLVIEDGTRLRARYPELATMVRAVDAHARVVLPIRIGERSIGGVSLGFEPRTFDEEELAFFLSLANAAAHTFERLRLAEAEREARGMLETVVAQMPVGVDIVARDGRFLFRNAALDRILGLTAGSLERPPAMHPDGRDYADDEWPVMRSLATGELVNEELTIRRADGTPVEILQTSAPVRDEAGEVVSAVVVTLDITDRKEAERLRDAFLGVLSHELRTPVTTIYGGAKMLASRPGRLDMDTRDELIADVAAEAERLSRLVDDLLVLARAERGVDLTVRSAALVQHRLRAVVAALAAEWPSRRIVCEIPEHVPPVTGDESYLEQVLRNLIGNAAKYGRSEVIVRVETLPDEVEVTVSDDGRGVAAEERERIFELFFRASTARPLPGAGIGLFVARRLVQAMGGRLWVSDAPGGGAAFTFRLPQFTDAGD